MTETGVRRGTPVASTVRDILSPVPPPVWAEVAATDPGTTAQQTPQYLGAVVQATAGTDASRLYVLADNRRLVLPLVRRTPVPGLHLDAGYPGGYGHGGLLATGGLRAEDVRLVLADLRQSAAPSVQICGHDHTAEAWTASPLPGVRMVPRRMEVLDLAGGWEAVWQHSFRSSARRNVRKAERAGVEIERDTTGRLVPVFHRLYRSWAVEHADRSPLPGPLARYRAFRAEPLVKFETVARALAERCRVWVAWHQSRPVASLITLVHGAHAIYWRGYSDKQRSAPVAANNLLQARAIEDACQAGCRSYNLGQSGGVAELERFKQTLGGTPRTAVDVLVERPTVARLRVARERAERELLATLSRR